MGRNYFKTCRITGAMIELIDYTVTVYCRCCCVHVGVIASSRHKPLTNNTIALITDD